MPDKQRKVDQWDHPDFLGGKGGTLVFNFRVCYVRTLHSEGNICILHTYKLLIVNCVKCFPRLQDIQLICLGILLCPDFKALAEVIFLWACRTFETKQNNDMFE